VVDQWGNIVSYTTTIEQGWGTGIMVPGYGFMLNNELTDFNFGFNMHPRFGGPGANDVQGGKRPRSSMTPTILFKGREPVAAFGSPGGRDHHQLGLHVLINLVDHGMTIQQAVDAPPHLGDHGRHSIARARPGSTRPRSPSCARWGTTSAPQAASATSTRSSSISRPAAS